MPQLTDAHLIRDAIATACEGLVDRRLIVEVVALCAVAGEHVLVVGPPGTAKSEAVRRVAGQLGGSYFEYLLGRFTEPSEIFGAVNLQRLREGLVEIETAGMLPEADIAFLDEVFLGSTAVLNTLLGILNERVYRRGSTVAACPLRVCVGATNVLPEDPTLAAFADRFLARLFVDPVADALLEEMLEAGWSSGATVAGGPADTLAALDRLAVAARRGCDLSIVQPVIGSAIRRLRAAGVTISDRRAVRSQRLVAAAAALDGRESATPADLWVLPLIAPTAEVQRLAQDTLADLLGDASNASLVHAAEEFSAGRRARANRLTDMGRLLMRSWPSEPSADSRLKVEATLREVDAAFGPADLTDELADVRAQLVGLLQ